MKSDADGSRRSFLQALGATAGAAALAPVIEACNRGATAEPTTPEATAEPTTPEVTAEPTPEVSADPMTLPMTQPEAWNAIAFNRDRGNAGAIPESYRDSINGPDGETGHLGKHIPYIPEVEPDVVPEGFLPLMFGDASRGYARHPASRAAEDGTGGHWYDWIKIRKAVDGDAEEVETRFSAWPELGENDSGRYAVIGGGEITEDAGRNTIYLVPIPADVGPGERVRVRGHCSLHGEYVDFLTVPG